MGLGEFDIGECKHNEQCQSLNDAEGISDDDCMAYQCRKDGVGCELRKRDLDGDGVYAAACDDSGAADCDDSRADRSPDQDETCDGIDNDCDLVIDEGLSRGATSELITFSESDARVYFSSAQREPSVSVGDGSASIESIDVRQSPWEATALEYRTEVEQDKQVSTEEGIDKRKCPRLGSPDLTACNFTELVGASAQDDGIVAAVDTEGCDKGLLRVGHLEEHQVVLRRPPEHSNIAFGVDSDGKCTGTSRASGILGVARPALAARAPASDFPQALLSLVAAPQDSSACPSTASDVEVLGIFREHIENNSKIRWTSATNDGVPQVLGQTGGGGRPVVLATEADEAPGYIVAYGDAGGGLALHFVEQFSFAPNDPYELSTPHSTKIRSTAPLDLGVSDVLFASHAVDHVALTQVVESDHLRLGVGWLEGACDSESSLHFAEVRYYWEAREFRESEPLTILTDSEQLKAPPSLAYVAEGFVMPGYENASGEKATSANSGGFLISWAEAPELYARRILDLDGQLLEEEPLGLYHGDGALAAQLFHAGEPIRFAVFDHEESTLRVGEVACTQ